MFTEVGITSHMPSSYDASKHVRKHALLYRPFRTHTPQNSHALSTIVSSTGTKLNVGDVSLMLQKRKLSILDSLSKN